MKEEEPSTKESKAGRMLQQERGRGSLTSSEVATNRRL